MNHSSSTPYTDRSDDQAILQHQFRLPRGPIGRIVGWLMARSNERMNRVAIDALKVQPNDDVLEIGFGPGHTIDLLVKRSAARFIAGVDPSEVMVEQASARNREAVDAGRVQLIQGAAESLPFKDGRFSKVFAVSNFQIWEDRARGLAEVRRVLRSDGTLAICLRRAPKKPSWFKSPGLTPEEVREDQRLLSNAKFQDVRLVENRTGGRLFCLIGHQ